MVEQPADPPDRRSRRPLDLDRITDDLQFLMLNDDRAWLVAIAQLVRARREQIESRSRPH